MPFYDLYCANCDEEYNIMASMADKTERRIPCPDCGTTDLKTVYSTAPAFIKGGGDPIPACASGGGCGAACPHAMAH
ncbi:MAG: zinc ribbon domain-containing protein [Oscillospiraceae bacterium]|nr:zinc ribbon domain-containing protein [Oscillospiraceae bacterium]